MVNEAPSNTDEQKNVNLELDKQKHHSKIKRLQSNLRMPVFINFIIVIIVAILLILLEWGIIPQTKQGFYCKDPSISFPFKGDTVSIATVLLGSCIGPLLIITFVETLKEGALNLPCIKIVWKWFRELITGLAITILLTEWAKVIVGEHRPHFLNSCSPDTNIDCESGSFVQFYRCTNSKHSNYFIIDSSRSFPSGHASISVFVSIYISFIIQWRLPVHKTGKLCKPFLIAVCFLWGLTCSLTRITDRRHHWWDVLAGSILGFFCAAYTIKVLCSKTNVKCAHIAMQSVTNFLDVKSKNTPNVII